MKVTMVPAYDAPEMIRELFSEYTQMLIASDPGIAAYLKLQNYDAEIAHLQDKYGLPHGRLYLLLVDGKAAGCIGLRRLNDTDCELKRLYVRSAFRGHHFAQQLADKIIADARSIGYRAIFLDTLPFLQEAIALYKKLGFYEIPSYNNSPLDSTIYMKLDLT